MKKDAGSWIAAVEPSRARAEDDAAGGRADDRLYPVVDVVERGDLVGDELEHEQDADDDEHPVVAQPGPASWERDENREAGEKPDAQQG